MSVPIDYLAFVEWPQIGLNSGRCCAGCCRFVADGEQNASCQNPECHIAQRNAALQAAHAMQERVSALEVAGRTAFSKLESLTREMRHDLEMGHPFMSSFELRDAEGFLEHPDADPVRPPDAPAAIPSKEE